MPWVFTLKTKTYRLDRFIRQCSDYSLSDTRLLVAQKRIEIDGVAADSVQQIITQFTRVVLDGVCLQDTQPLYMMLHKPKGVVSATKDKKHRTVLDLIDHPRKAELHIVGRLDFNTTGLVLLTNDGAWSRSLSLPESGLTKTYEVTVSKPLTEDYVTEFQRGIFFKFENITTKPAILTITSDYTAVLSITEGKYHQIKRMFGYFQNEVLALHRTHVGAISLGDLSVGSSRILLP